MEGKRALEVKTTYKEEFGEKEKKFKDRFWEDYSRRRCSFLQFYMKDLRVIAKKGKIHVDILKSIHSRTHGGHLGIDKTLVTRWIFWLKQARSNIMKWGGGWLINKKFDKQNKREKYKDLFRKSITYNFTVHFLFHIFNIVLKKGKGGGALKLRCAKTWGKGAAIWRKYE